MSDALKVVDVNNPSELRHCKFPATCDRTRACEQYRQRSQGCGSGDVVHRWSMENKAP